jgi:hypothetical protein
MDPSAGPLFRPSALARIAGWLLFVASAALVALAVRVAWETPLLGLLLVGLGALIVGPQWVARRRLRRLLISGNVSAVLAAWISALRRVAHPDTIVPIITATALAAHGMTDKARDALERAKRGPAWDAALEHRLMVETLLDAFEGERSRALETAQTLQALPLPPLGPWVRERVSRLRRAIGALARAFARSATPDDARALEGASARHPLVFWALRYAAAIAWVDHGAPERAERLLQDAPEWPEDSAFRLFHDELSRQCDVVKRKQA